jgi:hypothetical protein
MRIVASALLTIRFVPGREGSGEDIFCFSFVLQGTLKSRFFAQIFRSGEARLGSVPALIPAFFYSVAPVLY